MIVSEIEIVNVSNRILKGIRFRVPHGKTFVIVGPSGAGKTSLLKAIAGLASHEGTILIDGQEIQSLPPHLRGVGFVSQDLHLFPHLTLEGNLLLAMDRLNAPRRKRHDRAQELMKLLRIASLADRLPSMLSGGEKQRAALARVLASEPRILLLDEPLSKLDFRTARYLCCELRALLTKLRLTTLFVTHNLEEAREMGDDLAVLNEGVLTRIGFGAEALVGDSYLGESFLETPNILSPVLKECSVSGLVKITWAGSHWHVPDEGREFSLVAINPADIEIGAEPPPGPSINRFSATVASVDHCDDSFRMTILLNGEGLRVEMPAERGRRLGPVPGDVVHGIVRLKSFEII